MAKLLTVPCVFSTIRLIIFSTFSFRTMSIAEGQSSVFFISDYYAHSGRSSVMIPTEIQHKKKKAQTL